ncbi:MAG: hypothetical protein GDA42_11720 [Ekhidna sp.]|nr:hypothetical protein [Ekhidna sp.]
MNSYRPSIPPTDIRAAFFSYTLKVVQSPTGTVRHTQNFTLLIEDSKTISLNVSTWPRGLYVVNMYVFNFVTNQGDHLTRKVMIR